MTTNSWYADGLRWLGTLLFDAADHFERVSLAAVPLERHPDDVPPEERVSELRNRIQRYY